MNTPVKDREDIARLPEGLQRVGYDADTSQYTFLDRKGTMYRSESGNRYGTLNPVLHPNEIVSRERPQTFEGGSSTRSLRREDFGDQYAPKTFQDFLPPELITAPTYGPDDNPKSPSKLKHKRQGSSSGSSSSPPKRVVDFSKGPPTSPRSRFITAIRSSALPKMQGVVQTLRRSVTSAGKPTKGRGHKRSKSETLSEGVYAVLDDSENVVEDSREYPRRHD